MKVLFVDDDPDDFEVFCEALKHINPEAVCDFEQDGEAALKVLQEDPPELPEFIFLDVHMPRMNGAECLRLIKADRRLQDIPVIVFSSSIHPSEEYNFKELGAVDVIIKPSRFHEIVDLLTEKLKVNR